MKHQLLQFPAEWEWHMLHTKRPELSGISRSRKDARHAAAEGTAPGSGTTEADFDMKQVPSDFADWLQDVEGCAHNRISVSELPGGQAILHGTLLFQASDEQRDIQHLHFRVTSDKLVTYQSDMRLSVRLQLHPWHEKLHRCQSAPEAFLVILGNILETFHTGLDQFETRLGELEQKMSSNNKTGLMNVIFKRRYELLHWSHLFIPVKEIHGAAKEAFMNELAELEEFRRMELRMERVEGLLRHYAMEIDTLLMMDDAISNFRGNDIMKTLTIFTALFMPATVIGAVWGMNFNRIPWAGERWGFVTVCTIIVVTTLLIYWWLWHKGWTGDLLNGRFPSDSADKSRSKMSNKGIIEPGAEPTALSLPRRSRARRTQPMIAATSATASSVGRDHAAATSVAAAVTADNPTPLPSRSKRKQPH